MGRNVAVRQKSCGAVVFRKNPEVEYLVLHYGGGHWDYVKGQVERNESERDTAIRELREETSITDAHLLEGFREKIDYFYRREGRTIYKQVIFYLAEAGNSEVRLSYEHVGFDWLDYHDAMAKLTFNNAKNVLRRAHAFLKTRGIVKED